MHAVLASLHGGLIVSVQAEATSVLNVPDAIALLAKCAVANGAAGLRIEGTARIAAVRAAVAVPIVGIIKAAHPPHEPYITTTRDEVAAAIASGAEIVAFDATARSRPGGVGVRDLIGAIHAGGALAMADCADRDDVDAAAAGGADIVATTLAGYTAATHGRPLPALDLVEYAAGRHPFPVCEGGIATPAQAVAAFAAGAAAVVVGTAITGIDLAVRRFAEAGPRGHRAI